MTRTRTTIRNLGVVLLVLCLAAGAGVAQLPIGQAADAEGAADGPASVETAWADVINETAIVAAGNVTRLDANETATVWLEYRENGTEAWQSTANRTVNATGQFRDVFAGLESGAEYEYRARIAAGSAGDAGTVETASTPVYPPSVQTGDATKVTASSAALAADVGWLGNAESAEVTVLYRQDAVNEYAAGETVTVNESGTVAVTVTDLEPNATYEYYARADASDGDAAEGEVRTFTTGSALAVATESVTVVNETAVNATASVSGADDAEVGFQHRTADDDAWTTTDLTNVRGDATVDETVTGLDANETYEVRAVAHASDGDVAYGAVETVTTHGAFAVTTDDVERVNDTAATAIGSVADLGGADAANVTVEYREQGEDDWSTVATKSVSEPGDVAATVTGLDRGATYEFRVTGTASIGDEDAGAVLTLRTDTAPVTVTEDATDVTESAATLRGDLLDLGGADGAEVGFQYRADGDDAWTTTSLDTVDETGEFDERVTGLDANATYEFRAIVHADDGDTVYGAVTEFATDESDESGGSEDAPAVESFDVDQRNLPNPHLTFTAEWTVTDDDGDLDSVTIEVVDDDGDVVERRVAGAHGEREEGTERIRLKHVRDESFTVRLTVEDESGETTTETRTVEE